MSRIDAINLARAAGQPVIVPSAWGRFDYAMPDGSTASADTLREAMEDLAARGFASVMDAGQHCSVEVMA